MPRISRDLNAYVARLGITAQACEERIRTGDREDDEHRRCVFAAPPELLPYLASNDAGIFHPTARYRMLMFLLHTWGAEKLKRKLMHAMQAGDDDPLDIRGSTIAPAES